MSSAIWSWLRKAEAKTGDIVIGRTRLGFDRLFVFRHNHILELHKLGAVYTSCDDFAGMLNCCLVRMPAVNADDILEQYESWLVRGHGIEFQYSPSVADLHASIIHIRAGPVPSEEKKEPEKKQSLWQELVHDGLPKTRSPREMDWSDQIYDAAAVRVLFDRLCDILDRRLEEVKK